MPQVSEISSSMVPVDESPDASLQLSSTSPETGNGPPPSKALSVRKNVKHPSRSSSSSSRGSLPPSGLSRVASGSALSHRGQGSLPPSLTQVNQTEVHMDVDVQYDQRSMHHEQHFYDQRTQQQLNVVQVGLDPSVAHARESQLRTEALNAVAHLHQQSQEAQRVAEGTMSQAASQVAQVHAEASAAMSQLSAQHNEEVNRLQQIANQANSKLTLQLRHAENENRLLTDQLNIQKHELSEQRNRFDEMHATMLSLQHQLTVVRHQQPVQEPQNGADIGNLQDCINALRAEVQQIKEDRQKQATLHDVGQTVALPSNFNIATPVRTPNPLVAWSPPMSPNQSACAGYPEQNQSACAGYQQPNIVVVTGQAPEPSGSSSSSSSSTPTSKGKNPGSSGSPPSTSAGGPGGYPHGFPFDGGGPPDGGDGDGSPVLVVGSMGHRSVGVGSMLIIDESSIYKAKDLSNVTIPALPTDAAQFRGWRNSFLTKASSIDKTGRNRIMTWLLEAFSADVSVEYLEQTSLEMPRLDAYLASQIMEP